MHRAVAQHLARLSCATCIACACLSSASGAVATESVTLGVFAHVASVDGQPVLGDEFVRRQLRRAEEILSPHGVHVVQVGRAVLPDGHASLRTRADRDALGAHVHSGVIDAFFVATLYDVDEPGRVRRGVHWRSRTHRPHHYVVVSSDAFDAVLAHELGHFLGNPRHSETPGNLMSYSRLPGTPFLDPPQVTRMWHAVRAYLASGELASVEGPAR